MKLKKIFKISEDDNIKELNNKLFEIIDEQSKIIEDQVAEIKYQN